MSARVLDIRTALCDLDHCDRVAVLADLAIRHPELVAEALARTVDS